MEASDASCHPASRASASPCVPADAASAADDVAAAQGVIRAQEQALSRDDAAAAYSYAAPAIKEIFPDAGIFMSMVRNSLCAGLPPQEL